MAPKKPNPFAKAPAKGAPPAPAGKAGAKPSKFVPFKKGMK